MNGVKSTSNFQGLPCVKDHRIAGIADIDTAVVRSLAYMQRLVTTRQLA